MVLVVCRRMLGLLASYGISFGQRRQVFVTTQADT